MLKPIQLLIFFFLIVKSLTAQNDGQGLHWVAQVGGDSSSTTAISAVCDSQGNIYSTGAFYRRSDLDPSDSTFRVETASPTDPFLVDVYIHKLDSNGRFIWGKNIGGPIHTWALALTLDEKKNLYLAGNFRGKVDFDLGPDTFFLESIGLQPNAFFLKLDSAGNFIWAKSIRGLAGYDFPSIEAIEVDDSMNLYLTGDIRGEVDLDPDTSSFKVRSTGVGKDAFILKLDSMGTFVWAKQFEGVSSTSKSIAIDHFSNIYLTGVFYDSVDFDPDTATTILLSNGKSDIFISKLSPDGKMIWTYSIGGTTFDDANVIETDGKGNIYIAGYFEGGVDFDPGPLTSTLSSHWGSISDPEDAFVLKLDSSGNYVWAKNWGGRENDEVEDLAIDLYNNVYTFGTFVGNVDFDPDTSNFVLLSNNGYEEPFIHKLDEDGNFQWVESFGKRGVTKTSKITTDPFGSVYTIGEFSGTIDFNPGIGKDILSSQGDNGFISKIGSCSPDTVIEKLTSCDFYEWIDGVTYWENTDTAVFTLENKRGCDSVVFLDLEIIKSTTSVEKKSACYTYTWPQNGMTYTASGRYKDTIPNAVGCDSIINMDLIIHQTSFSYLFITTCDSYNWAQNNQTYTASGVYIDTSVSLAGCDSISFLYLTINQFDSLGATVTACQSYTWPQNGMKYSTSGVYRDSLTNASGCDSVFTLYLTINNIDTAVTKEKAVLTASAIGTNIGYQWLDCTNGDTAIAGATDRIYSVVKNGSYAVEITQDECVDTSSCIRVVNVGLTKNKSTDNFLKVFPNPTNERFTVELPQNLNFESIELYSIDGKFFESIPVSSNPLSIDVSNYPVGIYLIRYGYLTSKVTIQ